MDPNFNKEIRYSFVEMIKNITAKEALLLSILYDSLKQQGYLSEIAKLSNYTFNKEQIIPTLGISQDTYAISAHNLMRLQLIGPAVFSGGVNVGGNMLSSYKGIDSIYLSPLGFIFVEACIK
jgi:hypothetical protein